MAAWPSNDSRWGQWFDLWIDRIPACLWFLGAENRATGHIDRRWVLIWRYTPIRNRSRSRVAHFMGRALVGCGGWLSGRRAVDQSGRASRGQVRLEARLHVAICSQDRRNSRGASAREPVPTAHMYPRTNQISTVYWNDKVAHVAPTCFHQSGENVRPRRETSRGPQDAFNHLCYSAPQLPSVASSDASSTVP